MDLTIQPQKLLGGLDAIASKSQAHRLLICAAFADKSTQIHLSQTNQDILATAQCLTNLGAAITETAYGYLVQPAQYIPKCAVLPCKESGSTLRFLLPVVGALGVHGTFVMEGRLPYRPITVLQNEMERMGCAISRPTENTLLCQGKLNPGAYYIDGSESSQYITGLMLCGAVMGEPVTVNIQGKLESAPYIEITRHALHAFGVNPDHLGTCKLRSPGSITVEGDWSNAAFFLAANTLGSKVEINNLNPNSPQGDRVITSILQTMTQASVIDCTDCPDLVPVLAVAAAVLNGATFTGIRRLRLKESDRVASVSNMIINLGGRTEITEDSLTVYPTGIIGGTVDSCADHRIAMAAAIAATAASAPVTVLGAECVRKSYPGFWEDYRQLGGYYEQYLR